MEWIAARIDVDSDMADNAAAALLDFGIEGVEIIDEYANMQFIEGDPSNWDYVDESLLAAEKGMAQLRFYLPKEHSENENVLDAIKAALSTYGTLETTIVEDDWSEAWKQHYKPFKPSKNVVIVPVWEEYTPKIGEIMFKIDPGHVFGTGQHQSTALCIELLEQVVKPNANVLDIGCGSGILGIIALLLGAERVCAVDIDPSAVKVSMENARLNGIEDEARFTATAGNLLADKTLCDNISRHKYDLILANIIADVIIPLAPLVKDLLAQDGMFIASGIIRDRRDEVIAALAAADLRVVREIVRDEWVALQITSML